MHFYTLEYSWRKFVASAKSSKWQSVGLDVFITYFFPQSREKTAEFNFQYRKNETNTTVWVVDVSYDLISGNIGVIEIDLVGDAFVLVVCGQKFI